MSLFGIVIYIWWGVFLFLFPALVFVCLLALPPKLVFLEGFAVIIMPGELGSETNSGV